MKKKNNGNKHRNNVSRSGRQHPPKRKSTWGGIRRGRVITGTFVSNPRGFGFVETTETMDGSDIFIPPENMNGAWNKDVVEVELLQQSDGRRQKGMIRRIIERGTKEVVATYQRAGKYGFAVPDDLKIREIIFIPDRRGKKIENDDKVIVEILDYGDGRKIDPIGFVKEVLGPSDAPGIEIFAIAKSMNIPIDFPRDVLACASSLETEIKAEESEGRDDLRSWQTVTIDGPYAKDLDDAISLTEDENGYTLGVHIADVSHYVREGEPFDREALRRGTSVYLADRVIPMLPHELSNGICSLNAGTDRFALSVIIQLDRMGCVREHRIVESVIRVDERMSYPDVAAILDHSNEELCDRYRTLIPMFESMLELSLKIRKQREKRGAITFEFSEVRILLDEKGKAYEIVPEPDNCATRIIEDFMLTANETVAKEYCERKIPFVYRVHDDPDPDKIEELIGFVRRHGVEIDKKKQRITPLEISKALESIKGQPCEALISRIILRSMQQAKYSTVCTGHFGLAATFYCHFTSPIRRYPDLQIHRIIKEDLSGKLTDERIAHYKEILEEAAAQSSRTERRAEETERETEKLKKAEYMSRHIGEEFEGVISSVTGRGMFVELTNTVEGFVDIAGMCDDYYNYDEDEHALIGRLSHRVYALGDPVRIRMISADLRARTVEFELV